MAGTALIKRTRATLSVCPFNGGAHRKFWKENLSWSQTLDSIEQLRAASLDFRETYRNTWLIQQRGYWTSTATCQSQLSTAEITTESPPWYLVSQGRYTSS